MGKMYPAKHRKNNAWGDRLADLFSGKANKIVDGIESGRLKRPDADPNGASPHEGKNAKFNDRSDWNHKRDASGPPL